MMTRKEIAEFIVYKLSWAVPGGREKGKTPVIRPNATSPSRPGGIRSENPPRLWKKRLDSRASAIPPAVAA
jgi:hypothetical protein